MIVSLRFCRSFLLICAALLVAVALVLAAGVIPPVKAATFPGATPESAVPAFWVNVVLSLLTATVLGFIAIRTKGRSRISTTGLVLLAFLVLLLAFALVDAAFAYNSEGPTMQTAAILLFICSAADLLAAVLVITTVFVLPKRT